MYQATRAVSLFFVVIALLTTFSTLASQEPASSNGSAQSLAVKLRSGQLLSVINPRNNPGPEAQAALSIYTQEAIPLARESGFVNHGTLRVTETIVGDDQPGVYILATWPSEEADMAFEQRPEMQTYKALRRIIWEELKFYKAESDDAKILRFDQDKYYTIAFAWHDPEAPNDYQHYLEAIMPAVEASGGRFIHTMREPRYVSHSTPPPGPSEINLVEWDTKGGLEALQASELFLENYSLLHSGTTRFELHRIEPVLN